MIDRAEIRCPHCGAVNEVEIDYSAGAKQQLIEDCWTCCRAVQYLIRIPFEGKAEVEAERAY